MEYYIINLHGTWIACTNPNIQSTWGGVVYKTIDTCVDTNRTHVFGLCKTYLNGSQVFTTYTFSCAPFTDTGRIGLTNTFNVPIVDNLEF